MKHMFNLPIKRSLSLALLLMSVALLADATFVYTGRVGFTQQDESFTNDVTELSIRFRLYKDQSSTEALWGVTTPVYVDKNGNFQIELGDGMTGTGVVYDSTNTITVEELFMTDAARAIGVSIEGGAEQYPKQEIHSIPFAMNSAIAKGLTDKSIISNAKARGVYVNQSASINDLTVTNELSILSKDNNLQANNLIVDANVEFTLGTETEAKILGAVVDIEVTGISINEPLVGLQGCRINDNTTGGFLVIISRENLVSPCVTIPVAANETCYAPFSVSGRTHLRFYRFGN